MPSAIPTTSEPTSPAKRRPAPRHAIVRSATRLTPTLIRVVLGGPGMADFPEPTFTDSYVKLVFRHDGVAYPEPFDLQTIREQLPAPAQPILRAYTVRRWNAERRELTVDIVVHGDSGVAGPWAAQALPGDDIWVSGPGGAWSPDPGQRFHVFAGDESALPAIAAAVESLPADARGTALIEVPHAESELSISGPAGVEIRYLHTDDRRVGDELVAAVKGLDLPTDGWDAFVHGEAGFVKELRTHLRVERALPMARLSVSGYWRLGATDEGWRASKREWLAEAELAEQRAAARPAGA